jgi:hypothetical protein
MQWQGRSYRGWMAVAMRDKSGGFARRSRSRRRRRAGGGGGSTSSVWWTRAPRIVRRRWHAKGVRRERRWPLGAEDLGAKIGDGKKLGGGGGRRMQGSGACAERQLTYHLFCH